MAVSTVALSAAVTACEGMGQWELALHLFFQNSVDLSCSGIRFPRTNDRDGSHMHPVDGLMVDHGIPWPPWPKVGKWTPFWRTLPSPQQKRVAVGIWSVASAEWGFRSIRYIPRMSIY